MLLNCGVGEDSWESLGLQGDPTSPPLRKLVLNIHWKDRCWSQNSNTLATWCEELTHLKRPWRWERLKAGEGDDRGWDGWMASSTQWTWVWVNSGSWWWTGWPGVLQSMGSQRVRHDWVTELNWTVLCWWEYKLVQPLRKMIWTFLKNNKNRANVWFINPTSGYVCEENKILKLKQYVHPPHLLWRYS